MALKMKEVNKLLDIVFESESLIAINKPHGLLVHRTSIAKDASEFALQLLRDQTGQKIYPVHRLDRKTSGVLLFAKTKEANAEVQELFRDRKVYKSYKAIVRGYIPEKGRIDYPLHENNKTQEAITDYYCLNQYEIDLPFGKFPTSRYSLVSLHPLTGRHHQLRKHMAHIRHPIIGDRPHGCNKQNKLWKEQFDMTTMLLHAERLAFHFNNQEIEISAELSEEFHRVLGILEEGKNRLL